MTHNCAIGCDVSITLKPEFAMLERVTSDCRPFASGGEIGQCPACGLIQKPPKPKLLAEIETVYAEYGMFRQAEDGAEQLAFDDAGGVDSSRSRVIIEKASSIRHLPDEGRVLDVGCGNGAFLSAIAGFRPGWELNGHDLSTQSLDKLNRISGFRKLFTCALDEIDETFDLIVLSHSLEHFLDPVDGLKKLSRLLARGGMILVQVPDAAQNMYDLVTVDHISHFTAATLAEVAARAGYQHAEVWRGWVPKQLTLLLADTAFAVNAPPAESDAEEFLDTAIAQLVRSRQDSIEYFQQYPNVGLFGSAIAATWHYAVIGSHVAFFVEEDPNRIGRAHLGVPIKSVEEVAPDQAVFVGIAPSELAVRITDRLSQSNIRAASVSFLE